MEKEMKVLNKPEILSLVNERITGITGEVVLKKDIKTIVDAFLQVLSENVAQGNKVQLKGYFNLEKKEVAARKGHNPTTGQELEIPAHNVVKFSASKALKDLINQ